jgi:hypothetical protein
MQAGDLDRGRWRQGQRCAGSPGWGPWPFLDGGLRTFRELDGKGALEGTLGLFKEQDGVEYLAQMLGKVDFFLGTDGKLDAPVLRASDLEDELAGLYIDTPHLAFGQDGLEGRAAAEESDRVGSAVDAERACQS